MPAEFNIFLNTEKGKMQRLVGTAGYDGAMDVNAVEKSIVYASQASGDLEIWTMEFDGMNKRQLTHSPPLCRETRIVERGPGHPRPDRDLCHGPQGRR